jgi:hypothetical protein
LLRLARESTQKSVLDPPESGLSGKPGEGLGVGTGHPRLGTKTKDFGKQGGSPLGIEMRCNFVEQ